jgi:hypothetical protein
MKLGAAQGARQQQTKKAALDQRLDHSFGQLAALLDLVRGVFEQWREGVRALHIIDVARLGGCQIQLDCRHFFLPLPAAFRRRQPLP